MVWRADELPFGEEYQTQEMPERNDRRFLGKQLDKETGLVYMGARYLDPRTGRFTQPDPVGLVDPATGKVNQQMLLNPQRLNRYVYGLNNPYRYVDPEGDFAETAADIYSLLEGYRSYLNNVSKGDYRSAAVDTAGIVVDAISAAAPGIYVGAGVAINASRKIGKPLYKTTREATKAAKKLGFTKINETVHGGQAVFKKGKRYITRDLDGHNGGAWKGAKSVKGLSSKKTRTGTYDHDLKRIGD